MPEIDKRTIEVLNTKGAIEILNFLSKNFSNTEDIKNKKFQFKYSDLEKEVSYASGATFSKSLKDLVSIGFVDLQNKHYNISESGLYAWQLIDNLLKIPKKSKPVNNFDEDKNGRSWVSGAVGLITDSSQVIRITTRWYSRLADEKYNEIIQAFSNAKKRDVVIKIIVDPEINQDTLEILNSFKAEIKYLPCSYLNNPPKNLKPLFLKDFTHIMISDKNDWLYLDPHEKNSKVVRGKYMKDDPMVANYLADLFDTYWEMAKIKRIKTQS